MTDFQKPTGGTVPRQDIEYQDQQSTFQDHNGDIAITVWHERCIKGDTPPIPPFSFQVYITNGAKANDESGKTLTLPLLNLLENDIDEDPHYRLDVFFLPKATSMDECMSHYRAEKAHRAHSWPMHTLPTYSPTVPAGWQNLLFVTSDPGWQGEQTKARVDVCHFDLTEQAVREDREWEDEEDWRPMVKILKGVRVRFSRDEPGGLGQRGHGPIYGVQCCSCIG